MVQRVAINSRAWVDSHTNVWNDDASNTYYHDDHVGAENQYKSADYGGADLAHFAAPLMLESTGAILAYLIDVGANVAAQSTDPSLFCPPNTHFVHNQGCQPGSAVVTPPVVGYFGTLSCSAVGQYCLGRADCCGSNPCINNLCGTAGACIPAGSSVCDSASDCCSVGGMTLTCPTNQICTPVCSPHGGACDVYSDCCAEGDLCNNNLCCVPAQLTCVVDSDCCPGAGPCNNGTCTPAVIIN
jgi:hypothetical protein